MLRLRCASRSATGASRSAPQCAPAPRARLLARTPRSAFRYSTSDVPPSGDPTDRDKAPKSPSLKPSNVQKPSKHRQVMASMFKYWEEARHQFNWDKFAATASWILFGTTTWLILGTTTAVGLILVLMNLIEQQDYYAEKLGRYLSTSAGYRIHFGGRISSSLWEGKIRLRDVTLQNMHEPGPGEALIDLRVEELAVRLSLEHWISGGGLLTALEAQGVTGKIDGNAGGKVVPTLNNVLPVAPATPKVRGSFHLLHVEIRDADISVLPYGFVQPLDLKLFFARSSRLRSQYLLMDVLLADHVVGELNNALFVLRSRSADGDETATRLIKATGLPIQLLQSGGASGPLAWLTRGRFDISAKVQLVQPPAPPVQRDPFRYLDPVAPAPAADELASGQHVPEEELTVECNLMLSNLAATVPLATPHISYLASIGVRPVAAYLNANYTQIPLAIKWKQPVSAYQGAWYPNEAHLIESISMSVGEELASLVTTHRETRRLRSLLWLGLDGVRRGAVHAWHYATHYFWQLTPL